MPKPVCFVIMPFGQKPTGSQTPDAPAVINFDTFWEKAISPALTEIGYEPIRADQDIGALIIKEMLERLALADLVVADVSIPNANVYYEIGVRHAAKSTGCVLLAAEWSKQMFDIAQMPQLRYSITEAEISDQTGQKIKEFFKDRIPKLIYGESPVFQALPGYPDNIDSTKASSFKKFTESLLSFQRKTRAIRLSNDRETRQKLALELLDEFPPTRPAIPAISIELLHISRDIVGWEALLEYINGLPENLQNIPLIKEQKYLAISKTGDHLQAISALEILVEQYGDTSERQGIIGGRYKKLFNEEKDELKKEDYLDLAIEHYENGMFLDLNDYYPSSNLPRLYRTRGNDGDEDLARNAASIALTAAKRSLKLDPENEWIRPTLLGAAFDTGNVSDAEDLYKEIRKSNIDAWKLDTTLDDLKTSLLLHKEQKTIDGLSKVIKKLEALLTNE